MVEASVLSGTAQCARDLGCGPHLREGPLIAGAVVADGSSLSGLAGSSRLRQPLVLLVGNEARSIGEGQSVAGTVVPGLTDGHHSGGSSLLVKDVIARTDIAHSDPARRRRDRRIEREGLAESRPRRQDDQLPGMQAVGQRIEISKARRHTHHLAAAIGDGLDLRQRSIHEVTQRQIVLGGAALGDLIDLGLRAIHNVIDMTFAGVSHLHDAGARLDKPPQDRTLLDDGGVVSRVGRRRDEGDERVEVGRTADPTDLSHPGQLSRHGDGIDGIAAAVDGDDGVVDRRVRWTVEVSLSQRLDDISNRILAEHHGAEHRLLGGNVLGWGAIGGGATALIGDGQLSDAHAPSLRPCQSCHLHPSRGVRQSVDHRS